MYLRARWYDAQNGRFNRLDPFFGNLSDPQSLHKYAYVHGDPINGIDPSGETLVGTLGGVAIGGHLRGLKGAALGGALGAAADAVATFALVAWLRSRGPRDGTLQLPQRQHDASVNANRAYVRVTNSAITADELFERILQFQPIDYQNSPTSPTKNGDVVSWTLTGLVEGIGQGDFDVKIDQIDHERRIMSVVTLSGHPLSGFRYWQVDAATGDSRDFTIVTGAVEHNTGYNDWYKATIGGPVLTDRFPYVKHGRGNDAVLETWEAMLRNFVNFSGGTTDDTQSRIEGYWDNSLIPEMRDIVNWRYEN